MTTDSPPRYSFGDVRGIMQEGTAVSVGIDDTSTVTVDFDFLDRRDGKKYHVHARGVLTEIPAQEPNATKR